MKYAVCNELFINHSFRDSCNLIAKYGFTGIEIAPYIIAKNPQNISFRKVKEIKNILNDTGVQFVGFHYLLKAPRGFHLTVPDNSIRKKSWSFLKFLIEICKELDGNIMVLGSSKQRNAIGISKEKTTSIFKGGLKDIAPFAEKMGVKILIEVLPSRVSNIINTLQEAKGLIYEVGSPSIAGMFDFHNCEDEGKLWHNLIYDYSDIIKHVHLNEIDGNYPGKGRSDFFRTFKALKEKNYNGWVSLEIFHFDDSSEIILSNTKKFILEIEKKLNNYLFFNKKSKDKI